MSPCKSWQRLASPHPGARFELVSDSSLPTAAATHLGTSFPETGVYVRHHCNLTFHCQCFYLLGVHLFKFCRWGFVFVFYDLFLFFKFSDISSGTVQGSALLFHLALLTTLTQ